MPTTLRYHELARLRPRRWPWVVAGLLAAPVLFAIFSLVPIALTYDAFGLDAARPDTATPAEQAGELAGLLAALALALPAVLLVLRWFERRSAGTLASVAGRWRWRLFARCLLPLAGAYAVYIGAGFAIEPPAEGPARVDWVLVAAVCGVALVTVPLQAAAEEAVFRGYLPQLVGRYLRAYWVPAMVLSLAFGVAHGLEQGPWGIVNRTGFGLLAAWLVLRTGGLEAAVALHLVGNVFALTGTAVDGEVESFLTGGDERIGALEAMVDLAVVVALGLLLLRLARRHRVGS